MPVRVVAHGRLATVFAATAPDGREVAVKLIKPSRASSPTAVARLRAEAGHLRAFASPSVVAFVDEGEHDGRPYVVMELANGGSLDARLVAGAPSDPWITARVALALVEALEPLHARGFVHGDVHPANLLIVTAPRRGTDADVTMLDEDERVVLCDLELLLDTNAATPGPRALGAPGYGAPELADPAVPVTVAADVHACAAVLWAVISSGSPPARGDLEEALGTIPPHWREVFAAGLCPDPAQRTPSVRALARAVVAALDVDLRAAGLDPIGAATVLG